MEEFELLKQTLAVAKGEFLNPNRPFNSCNVLDAQAAQPNTTKPGRYLDLSIRDRFHKLSDIHRASAVGEFEEAIESIDLNLGIETAFEWKDADMVVKKTVRSIRNISNTRVLSSSISLTELLQMVENKKSTPQSAVFTANQTLGCYRSGLFRLLAWNASPNSDPTPDDVQTIAETTETQTSGERRSDQFYRRKLRRVCEAWIRTRSTIAPTSQLGLSDEAELQSCLTRVLGSNRGTLGHDLMVVTILTESLQRGLDVARSTDIAQSKVTPLLNPIEPTAPRSFAPRRLTDDPFYMYLKVFWNRYVRRPTETHRVHDPKLFGVVLPTELSPELLSGKYGSRGWGCAALYEVVRLCGVPPPRIARGNRPTSGWTWPRLPSRRQQ